MDLSDYLRIARERWLWIVVCTLLAATAAAALSNAMTKQYKSSASLFITTPKSSGEASYQGGLFSQERVKSYQALVTGEEFSRRVIDKLDLDEEPRDLATQLSAEAKPDTVVLVVSVIDTSPKRAQRIARAASEVFVDYVKELETTDAQGPVPIKASIVDAATLPVLPVSPQPVRNTALGVALGLLVGFGLAVLRDSMDTRIRTLSDIEDATGGAPQLGNIHFSKSAVKTPLITSFDRHAPRAEAFRVLATHIQFVGVDSDHKVFVVTSALPDEGKSTTSCNLAIALADAGCRVLLIEGDLRRPKASSYFGIESRVGVSTVLAGRVDFDEAVQMVSSMGVMASGACPPNQTELLQSRAMKRLIATARERFDYVIIDAPPLLPVTDAALLASQADGAILVVRHGRTRVDEVRGAVARLESVGAAMLGTITNMSPEVKRSGGRYGYGYGYGYAPTREPSRRAGPEAGERPDHDGDESGAHKASLAVSRLGRPEAMRHSLPGLSDHSKDAS